MYKFLCGHLSPFLVDIYLAVKLLGRTQTSCRVGVGWCWCICLSTIFLPQSLQRIWQLSPACKFIHLGQDCTCCCVWRRIHRHTQGSTWDGAVPTGAEISHCESAHSSLLRCSQVVRLCLIFPWSLCNESFLQTSPSAGAGLSRSLFPIWDMNTAHFTWWRLSEKTHESGEDRWSANTGQSKSVLLTCSLNYSNSSLN